MATTTIRVEVVLEHSDHVDPSLVRAQLLAALEQFDKYALTMDENGDEVFINDVRDLDAQEGEQSC